MRVCVCVYVRAHVFGPTGAIQSSWTKVRWPISHPADACTSDPRRQVEDTNWQRAPSQSRVEPMVGEAWREGGRKGEVDDKRSGTSGGHKLAPHLLLQTIKTSTVGRASGLMVAPDTQYW